MQIVASQMASSIGTEGRKEWQNGRRRDVTGKEGGGERKRIWAPNPETETND